MEISVNEFTELSNKINDALETAYEKGVNSEKERELPNNFFESLIKYAQENKILYNMHRSSDKSDGCNWIQIKPTRTQSELVDYVEIAFNENLMDINFVGVGKEQNTSQTSAN